LVELIVGALWGFSAWQALRGWQGMDAFLSPRYASLNIANLLFNLGRKMILCWLLTALAFLDLENFWLPDWLTLTGAGLGCLFNLLHFGLQWILGSPAPELLRNGLLQSQRQQIVSLAVHYLLGILAAALLVLAVRWAYWLVRRREGIGLGDAKLMALLAAWLGFPPALLCLALAAVLGALVALLVLALPKARRQTASWSATKLPLGTFLCLGGMISTLWGPKIIAAYLRWAGL
jgi:leader peptidase (prepilin peptidase)/N-methyltransferase